MDITSFTCCSRDCRYSVGALILLYEQNYKYLTQLLPELKAKGDLSNKILPHAPDLELKIQEQHKYTTLISLKYLFQEQSAEPMEVMICLYHDAKVAEIVPTQSESSQTRWKNNRFLERWLAYCLVQNKLGTKVKGENELCIK